MATIGRREFLGFAALSVAGIRAAGAQQDWPKPMS